VNRPEMTRPADSGQYKIDEYTDDIPSAYYLPLDQQS
jgi:hypothetical protein